MSAIPVIKACVPYNNQGAVHHRCQASLDALIACPNLKVDLLKIQGCLISHNRNFGVSGRDTRVKQSGFPFDYYLALDSDIAFKPEDVLRLIGHDKDIIAGAYAYRPDPNRIVAGNFNDSNKFDGNLTAESFFPNTMQGVVKADFLGTGFLLVKSKVFEALEFPWFREEHIHQVNEKGEDCAVACGEDIGFCLQAKRAGFEAYVDCDCKVEHILSNGEFLPEEAATWASRRKETLQIEMQQVNAQIAELSAMGQRITGAIALIDEQTQAASMVRKP
jgi:hypothetical protein